MTFNDLAVFYSPKGGVLTVLKEKGGRCVVRVSAPGKPCFDIPFETTPNVEDVIQTLFRLGYYELGSDIAAGCTS